MPISQAKRLEIIEAQLWERFDAARTAEFARLSDEELQQIAERGSDDDSRMELLSDAELLTICEAPGNLVEELAQLRKELPDLAARVEQRLRHHL